MKSRNTAKDKLSPATLPVGPYDLFASHRSLLLLGLASVVLQTLIVEPLGLWPFAFICLVPWLLLVGGASLAPRVYFHSYLLGLTFFLINMRWLHTATAAPVPGLPFRIGWGYLALAGYLSAYFPFVAIPLRHAVRRRQWPLAIILPLVWTGSELLRAIALTGFPWFFLSHSLHSVLSLIQTSDLVGAYGVTFMIAAMNGAVGDVLLVWIRRRREGKSGLDLRASRWSLGSALGLLLATLGYGIIQLNQQTTSAGPKVAVIQGDFLDSAFPSQLQQQDSFNAVQRMQAYLAMIDEAANSSPDLILLPESPWAMLLNPEARDLYALSHTSFRELQARASQYGVTIVTGSGSQVLTPNDLLAKERRHNSATVFRPDGTEPKRYDKVHVVMFGETVPFRFGKLRFLYFWINKLMPFSGPDGSFEYSIFAGSDFRRFEMNAPSLDNELFRFAIPICYEDVMPYVSREFTYGGSSQKQVDFLLNISNDGWFGRGIQQPQHLAICVFRAIENRIGIARAVNTGGSAFIDPSGRITNRIEGDPSNRWPGKCGIGIDSVQVDSRFSVYSRYGDWFAWGCALVWLVIFLDYWITRARALAGKDSQEAIRATNE